MGDVISSHLDESRRQYISERTGKLLAEFGKLYEEQYGVALFNSVRYEIEGNGGPQTQLLHRKVPNIDKVIFSGNLFQYLDDTKKWRNRFCLVPNHYGPLLYENKIAYDRGLQPRAGINCAGYRVFTSLDQYTDMLNNSVPGGKVKAGSAPMKCATQFPVILWHPYCRHYHFCFMTEREQQRWSAVFQDCVRHSNNGIPEEARVEAAAFTDSVRLYRQARDQYGTWDMLCGNQVQVLSNLVMEDLLPDLKNIIGPKLRGKPQDRQRAWLLISDTVYRMVHEKARLFYEGLEKKCGDRRAEMESQIRTDMDQIIACKEHVSNKIRAAVLPKAELCVRNHVQSHIPSILEALMVPTSQGFSEVRELVFTEATEMNKNLVNEGGRDKLGEHMEKISQLAYHPVKMQQCYEKMDHLNLEGLQQRFDVGGPSVFKQRAQILMREQTDNAVYTLEQLIHQDLNKTEGTESLCRDIQRILERVLKKYDYDSSTVRKRFFQEALLQIIIPFLLKKLAPTCKSELPRYQELIFEELSRFVLLENIYEEVVLQTVMRDIIQAVKDAATQRKHNLYRDSMVLHNSDPNLHLLGEGPPINWTDEFGDSDGKAGERHGRVRQVVSIIQDDEAPEYLESCLEAPANENIPEEPGSSDVHAIRSMLVKEFDVEVPAKDIAETSSRVEPVEEVTHAVRETPESHTEVHASAHEHHGDTLDHSHAEAAQEHEHYAEVAPEHERHAEAAPEHERHAEASPEHERHAEAAPEHERHAEAAPEHERHAAAAREHERHAAASPEHERHAAASPEHERHAAASPEHERHAAASPEHERHAEASPEHERHAEASPEHERHAEASPEHERHAEASPEHERHAEASPEHERHAEATPEHKRHAEASPEHERHAEASPEHKSHAGASPEHESHAGASPEHVSHAEASPEHVKPVYRSATDILKDVHTKQVERSQPTSDHLVDDRQRFTPEAVKECASPDPSEIEEDDHRVQGINHRPTTPEVTSSFLVTPTEESQAQPLPSPVTHIVHSTPDDSGFQSPLSEEEEEGEGYKEVPVPAPRKRDEVITQF